MPTLPSQADLGMNQTQGGIGVAGYRTGQVAEAEGELGKTISGVAQDTYDNYQKTSYLAARNQFLIAKVNTANTLAQSNDYQSYVPAYNSAMQDAKNTAMASITDPHLRAQFADESNLDIAQGAAEQQARSTAKYHETDQADAAATSANALTAAFQTNDTTLRGQLIQNAQLRIQQARDNGSITPLDAFRQQQELTLNYAKSWAQQPENQGAVLAAAGVSGRPLPTGPGTASPYTASPTATGPAAEALAAANGGASDADPGASTMPTIGGQPIGSQHPVSSHGVQLPQLGNLDMVAQLAKTIHVESNGNAAAVSPTGAAGPVQLTKGTASQYGVTDPHNYTQSVQAFADKSSDDYQHLQSKLGREPTPGEMYLAWNQGAGGASTLIKADPNENVVTALAPAYKGNEDKAAQAVVSNGGSVNMTAGQFQQKVEAKFGSAPAQGASAIGYYPPTGTPLDFLPPQDRHAITDAALATQRQAVEVAKIQQEQVIKQAQSDALTKFYNGNLTPNEVLNDPNLPAFGEGSKQTFVDLIKKGNTTGNPTLAMQLYSHILNNDGAVTPASLTSYMSIPNGINQEQAENLQSKLHSQIEPAEKNYYNFVKSSLSKSNDLMGQQDPDGDAHVAQAMAETQRRIAAGNKAGIPTSAMLDPGSKQFIGNDIVRPLQRSGTDILLQQASAMSTQPIGTQTVPNQDLLQGAPSGAAAPVISGQPTRQPGESMLGFIQRSRKAKGS